MRRRIYRFGIVHFYSSDEVWSRSNTGPFLLSKLSPTLTDHLLRNGPMRWPLDATFAPSYQYVLLKCGTTLTNACCSRVARQCNKNKIKGLSKRVAPLKAFPEFSIYITIIQNLLRFTGEIDIPRFRSISRKCSISRVRHITRWKSNMITCSIPAGGRLCCLPACWSKGLVRERTRLLSRFRVLVRDTHPSSSLNPGKTESALSHEHWCDC